MQFMTGCAAGSALAVACVSLKGVGETAATPGPPQGRGTDVSDDDENEDGVDSVARLSNARRRVSKKDFYNDICLSQINLDALTPNASSWEIVLANGTREDIDMMDVLFVGHEDG